MTDLVPHYLDAIALVRDGVIPIRGTVSGYGAYNPPGPTWLMVPGVLATDNPQLVEFVVTPLLYVATLLGIYCLARPSFGRPAALLAAGLYAFSDIGLFVAGSLWPRAPIQPFFVWMVYWLMRWAINREIVALPIAVSIWATGMFVFMEIAPALLLVLFCGLRYRPPIRVRPLAIAAAAMLLLWWPYLAYEAEHDYRDLKSMVLRAGVGTPAVARGEQWCDRHITIISETGEVVRWSEEAPAAVREPQGALRGAAITAYKGLVRLRGALGNAVHGPAGGSLPDRRAAHVLLFIATAFSLIAVAIGSTALGDVVRSRRLRPSVVRMVLGMGFIGLALAGPPIVSRLASPDGVIEPETRDALATLRMLCLTIGVTLVLLHRLWNGLARIAGPAKAESSNAAARRFLVFSLLLPWAALVITAESQRSDRLWWLWPLVTIFLSALVFHIVGMTTVRRRIAAGAVAALLLGLSCVNPSNITRLQSWRAHGWAGVEADEVAAIDYVSSRVAGRHQPKIGYHLPFFQGITTLSALDARFKVGAELDVFLLQKHRIVNADRCAEGFHADDDYRLADDAARPPNDRYRIAASSEDGFRKVRQFGRVTVFERLGWPEQ